MYRFFRLCLAGMIAMPLVMASFAAGPASAAPPACQPGTPAPTDPYPGTTAAATNFESGTLSPFTPFTAVTGTASVSSASSHSPGCSAFLHATTDNGSIAKMSVGLTSGMKEAYTDGWFNVAAEGVAGNDVPYFRFFSGGIRYLDVFRHNISNDLVLRVTSPTGFLYTTVVPTVALGTWHHLVMHVVPNGASTGVQIWWDDKSVFASNTVNITAPRFDTVQLGAEHDQQKGDLYVDDVIINSGSETPAPIPGSLPTPMPPPGGGTGPTDRTPTGHFDDLSMNVTANKKSLRVSGWVVDRADTSKPTEAHVYITAPDGTRTGYAVLANGARPDVQSVFGFGSNHGFDQMFGITAPGTYNVCVFAIGILAKPEIGCKPLVVAVSPSPVGFLDGVSVNKTASGANLVVSGWTVDKGTPTASIPAHVYITAPDGTTQGYPFTADQPRPDVNQFLGVTGNHGYTATIPIAKPGTYRICSYGIAVTPISSGNSQLGCTTKGVAGVQSPLGFLEPLVLNRSASGASITARGWTADPGTPANSIPVHIYVTSPDGRTQGYPFSADQVRPDVNQAIGVSGNHGFVATLPITQPGTYNICSYGIAVTPLSFGNSLNGCRTLNAPASPAPIGSLESVSVAPSATAATLTAVGWTADRGTATASIPVHTYVTAPDGTRVGYAFTANLSRPDVNQIMNLPGNHGYKTSVNISQRGNYTVCTYGLAVTPLAAAGFTELGCRAVLY
jgi:hypothetical protein